MVDKQLIMDIVERWHGVFEKFAKGATKVKRVELGNGMYHHERDDED